MAKTKVKRHKRKKGRITVRKHKRSIKKTVASNIMKEHPKMSQKDAGKLFDMVMGTIKSDIHKQKRVSIPKFGTFKLKRTKAKPRRKVRNPFSGETVWAKPKKAGFKIRFRAAKK